MENKTFLTIGVTAVFFVVIAGWFYWFEYRIYLIERDCSDKLLAKSVQENKRSMYDDYFKMCVNSGGYEKLKVIIDANKTEATKESTTEPKEVQIITSPTSN